MYFFKSKIYKKQIQVNYLKTIFIYKWVNGFSDTQWSIINLVLNFKGGYKKMSP